MTGLVGAALTLLPRPRPNTLPAGPVTGTVTVDRAHLARYQRVCGYGLSDRLPAAYPHVLGFELAMGLLTRWDFPFPVVGLVHVANRIEQLRPLTAEDRLELSVQAADLRAHPRGRQFDVVTTGCVDGEVRWRDTSTYLRKGTYPHQGLADASREPREAKQDVATAPWSAPHAVWRVGTSVGTDYAAASGDHNPIHTSRLGARLFGFPRPIAHGMWSKARCLAALDGRLPARYTVDAAFKLPILLPAQVAFTARISNGRPLDFQLYDAKTRRPHLSATITTG